MTLMMMRRSSALKLLSCDARPSKRPVVVENRCRFTCENDLKIEYLKANLNGFSRSPDYYTRLVEKNPKLGKFQRASVLVPISIRMAKNAKGHYVPKSFFTFTRRTTTVRVHKGEVCFVGGKQDDNETEVETAYREANEEVGIKPEQLTFLGQLCPILTTRAMLITPVLAYFDKSEFEPKLSRGEVDLIFELATDRFLSEQGYRGELVKANKNDEFCLHYFEDQVDGQHVTTWGFTAFLAIVASNIIHSRLPAFSVDPKMEMNNDNVHDYLDNYLLVKMHNLINKLAK